MKRIFILLGILFSLQTAFSQNIAKAEYFFDVDPGQGNGITIPGLTQGDIVNLSFAVPTTGLSSGFHFLNVRATDVNGIWSRYETRFFYLSGLPVSNTTNVVSAEYFIDSDPGVGNGTPVTIGSSGAVVNFPVSISLPLSSGFHFLAIRVKDQEGKWSLFEQRSFYVAADGVEAPPIVAAEYFFDVDPGIGNASPLIVDPTGNIITQTFLVPVPGSLLLGDHFLAIRVKDQQGHWSFFAKDTLNVNNSASISCPPSIVVAASAGQCTSIVNNIDPVISPAGSSYNYTLTGATTGSGTGTASGKIFNVGVTTVTYALSSSPSTSCSFTVTVNTNVVPSVTISANNTSICTGGTIVFTAIPTNGGNNPHYQWKQNGNNVGTDSVILQTNQLNNGDVVSVVMTSSISCANSASVTSNSISVTVTPPYIVPTINITASSTSICPGTPVTFTAHSTNGGVPWYSWYVNNVWIPRVNNSDTFNISTLANGDKVKCVMTSTLACVTDVTTISNEITMSVGNQPSSVSIDASDSSICSGQLVTFTATPTNGGSNPQFEWTVNNNAVNIVNSPTYQSSTLQNGDVVRVTMQPSGGCGGNAFVYSNSITMSVGSSVVPSVTIDASATNICAGTAVTFTASPINQGSNPIYQWKLNGYNIPGANGTTYQTSSLSDGDQIKFAMVSSLGCADPSDAVSNMITMNVVSGVTPSVSIYASQTSICTGWLVKFFATPVNGGDTPIYQWKLNGNDVGTNSGIFQSTTLNDNDVVSVVMTSSLSCASQQSVESNTVTITVGVPVMPSVSIEADNTAICAGTLVTFTAHPTNGGYTPQYLWMVNGNDAGVNSDTYQSSTLANGDSIQVIITSSLNCAIVSTAISNKIHMTVTQLITYYADKDGDGYGDASDSVVACGLRAGFVTNKNDCNDNNALVYPGATEICGNGIDDDCDGQTDEGCTQNLPTLVTRNYPAKEGDAGLTTVNIEVSLDLPAPLPVSVKFKTVNEDAIAEADYEAASGTLLIPAGKQSGSLQVRIIGDLLRESNERFKINFSNPVNVLLPADPNSRIMIIDDDKGKPNSASPNKDAMTETAPFKIPTAVKRNTVWTIPQIGNYENEVLILNVQGQIVSKLINYKNQTPVGNVATGLYFYRIRITESSGQSRYYSGRLLISE